MRIFFLTISILVGTSASSSLVVWAIIEVNLLCFLGLAFSSVSTSWEVIPKYFVVQSLGSAGLLLILLTSDKALTLFIKFVFVSLLLLKMGGWPFYSWFVNMRGLIHKEVLFIFFTIQKVLPLYLLSLLDLEVLLEAFVFLNAAARARLVLKTTDVNFLLAFSSVFNLSWIIALSQNFSLVLLFLMAYGLSLWPLVCLIESCTKLNNYSFIKQRISATLLFRLFSFGLIGVPPSITFFAKIRALGFILSRGSYTLGLRLLLFSAFFIYAYARLVLEGLSLRKARGPLVSFRSYRLYLLFLIVWVFPLLVIILEDSI